MIFVGFFSFSFLLLALLILERRLKAHCHLSSVLRAELGDPSCVIIAYVVLLEFCHIVNFHIITLNREHRT
jgi:hypothetical protein